MKHVLRISGLVMLVLTASTLGGCGTGSSTRLPEITADNRQLLSQQEQKAAIADLERRKTELEAQVGKPVQ